MVRKDFRAGAGRPWGMHGGASCASINTTATPPRMARSSLSYMRLQQRAPAKMGERASVSTGTSTPARGADASRLFMAITVRASPKNRRAGLHRSQPRSRQPLNPPNIPRRWHPRSPPPFRPRPRRRQAQHVALQKSRHAARPLIRRVRHR